MSEEEGGGLGRGRSANPFETDANHDVLLSALQNSMMSGNSSEAPPASNAEQVPAVSADNGKKRRKLHRKADDPNYNSERQRFYRKIRQGRFDPTHPDADLQKYSNIKQAF
eukprot:1185369-Rhodomonas_salina.1